MLALALRPYPVSPSDTSKDFVVAIFYFKMGGSHFIQKKQDALKKCSQTLEMKLLLQNSNNTCYGRVQKLC